MKVKPTKRGFVPYSIDVETEEEHRLVSVALSRYADTFFPGDPARMGINNILTEINEVQDSHES